MKKSEFLVLVQEELDTIKRKATKEEIKNLNFKYFSHSMASCCVYGQMTGSCDSERANELYPKMFCKGISGYYQPFSSQNNSKGTWFTPLEKYLYMVKPPQHEKLIQYLKGEIEIIKL
jgi:hypothetical protein